MIRYWVLVVWLVLVYGAARWLPNWHPQHAYADLIPPSAQQVLAQQDELVIDVFALPDSAAASLVGNFLQPLLAVLPRVEVNFLDPSQHQDWVQQLNITQQGEMVIRDGDQSFKLSTLSYEAFFNGLKQLDQPQDRWVVLLDQVGGRSFNPGQAGSLNAWLNAMAAANYPAAVLSWNPSLQLPAQTQLVVLPAPAQTLDDTAVTWLEQQFNQGISLLWLADPTTIQAQPNLALMFDVMPTDGYHQGSLVIKHFPAHPLNEAFDRPLNLVGAMPFETANQSLWQNEQGQTLAATGQLGNSRLLVVGDIDFLSDEHLYDGGNLEMSFRLLDWLLLHDDRIDLPSIGHGQTQLLLTPQEVLSFAALMLLVLPLLFLLLALYHWRKLKRG
ncbi:hypothetical protein [Marinicella meishanensis]|uniref:hypothetical protein n=1 Tax=Marinicella meishanensis TaxID=2873263 RepID=UPI001CBCE7AA|nr:hypothetical protein [Marinicella sp. NBU2979]